MRGLLLKAIVLQTNDDSKCVKVHISDTDPSANQYHLNGHEMLMEMSRVHPGTDADRLVAHVRVFITAHKSSFQS